MICLLINLAVTENHLEMYYGQYGVEPITYLGAFSGILLIVLLSWKFDGKVIRYLGRNSMIYYAWHQTIVIPLVDEFYRKQGYFQQLKLSTMQFFCKNIISVVMICLVLTVVSILMNHTFLRVAVGGLNNPVSVSLLSGDRKPQIRFLGNHHSGDGNLYHKSFRM